MKLARTEAIPMTVTRPTRAEPGANAPGQQTDRSPQTSVRRLLGFAFLLAFALLPEVARAQVQNSYTIRLSDNTRDAFEIRGSGRGAGGTVSHRFLELDIDASVLGPSFTRPSDDRAGRSFDVTFSIDAPTGERPGHPRFSEFDVGSDRPVLRFNPSDRVRVRVRPNPTQPIPEPHAALLFATGIGVIAATTRRRR